MDDETGFLLAEDTGSALDGPGLRTVFWLSGCAFRCLYCHNPDSWSLSGGKRVSADDLVSEARKYASFMRVAGGGVTLSGGEPLVQAGFAKRVLGRLHEMGVHTALDTNGFFGERLSDADLAQIDLVLLDLKSFDVETHRRLTGQSPEPVFAFARRLSRLRRPLWVRFVLVPGITDQPEHVHGLARFCADLAGLERVEVLPFHQLGRPKWHALGRRYELERTEPPGPAALAAARGIFREYGLVCHE